MLHLYSDKQPRCSTFGPLLSQFILATWAIMNFFGDGREYFGVLYHLSAINRKRTQLQIQDFETEGTVLGVLSFLAWQPSIKFSVDLCALCTYT